MQNSVNDQRLFKEEECKWLKTLDMLLPSRSVAQQYPPALKHSSAVAIERGGSKMLFDSRFRTGGVFEIRWSEGVLERFFLAEVDDAAMDDDLSAAEASLADRRTPEAIEDADDEEADDLGTANGIIEPEHMFGEEAGRCVKGIDSAVLSLTELKGDLKQYWRKPKPMPAAAEIQAAPVRRDSRIIESEKIWLYWLVNECGEDTLENFKKKFPS